MTIVSIARRALPLAVLASALCLPSLASAAITSRTGSSTVTPTAQSATAFGGVSLHTVTDQTYDSYSPPSPALLGGVSHIDDDFVVDTTGLPQCSPLALTGTTTAQALVNCGSSKVGSGGESIRSQIFGPLNPPVSFSAVFTIFNGPPSGGNPTMLIHARFEPPNAPFSQTVIATCMFSPSSLGGDFGLQTSCNTGGPGGLAGMTHLETTFDNIETTPGHYYLSARCGDPDQTWNFYGEATFSTNDTPGGQNPITSYGAIPCQVASSDTDGDGIDDAVDLDPAPSNDFSDVSTGGNTVGQITDHGGLAVTVADSALSDPYDGVHVSAGPGSGYATVEACGLSHQVLAGTETTITCNSSIVNVEVGQVNIVLGGGLTVVSIPAGSAAEVTDNGDGTFAVENLGTNGDVTITVDGVPSTVGPGATATGGVPTTTQQCKKNGWRLLNDGSAGFKNQGACVSFVASVG